MTGLTGRELKSWLNTLADKELDKNLNVALDGIPGGTISIDELSVSSENDKINVYVDSGEVKWELEGREL